MRHDKLSRRQIEMLERVFNAEISNRLPLQSRSKLIAALAVEGFVEPVIDRLGGRFPMTIEGYILTHRGRMAYCDWASKQKDSA